MSRAANTLTSAFCIDLTAVDNPAPSKTLGSSDKTRPSVYRNVGNEHYRIETHGYGARWFLFRLGRLVYARGHATRSEAIEWAKLHAWQHEEGPLSDRWHRVEAP